MRAFVRKRGSMTLGIHPVIATVLTEINAIALLKKRRISKTVFPKGLGCFKCFEKLRAIWDDRLRAFYVKLAARVLSLHDLLKK